MNDLIGMQPTGSHIRELIHLALPVVTVQVGMMFMGTVDTLMVGRVSPTDLAAVALGSLYYFTATVFGLGVLLALDPLVSQAVGARDHASVGRSVQRGIVLSVGLAVVAMSVMLPAERLLALLGQPPDVVPVAAGYVRASMWGVFPFYFFVVCRQTLQAMGKLAPIVTTIVAANVANAVFNWLFVFGEWGFPAMGAVGTGVASSLSRVLMGVALVSISWSYLRPHLLPLRRDAFDVGSLGRMLRLGAPIGVQFGLEFGAFGVIGLLMGTMGTIAMAGHQVAISLASLTFMVPLGLGQAAAILVGRAVGRGDSADARRAAGAGLAVGSAFMVVTAILFIALPGALAGLYTAEPAVLALALTLIPVAGLFQVFDGLQVVASAVLRGIGDTRAPMVINIIGFWAIGFPVSLWAGFRTNLGPVGLWWGLVVGLGAVGILLLIRVNDQFRRDLRRVDVDHSRDEVRATG